MCGLDHTEGKLDLCYGSTGRSDHNGFLESKSQQTMVGRSQAKSFSADLGGNKKVITRDSQRIESIANKVKLKA